MPTTHELPIPVVSALTAGVLILLQLILMLLVALTRRRNRISLGDGGNEDLQRVSRRHGNLAENAALFIAGFTLFELIGGPRQSLIILCSIFVAGRLAHAIGLSMKNTANVLRILGIVATIGVGLVLGVRLALMGWEQLAPTL
jgi:uncharacterized membrane protein YecN with MAPEG domain